MEPTVFSFIDEEKAGRHAIGAVGYRHDRGSFHDSFLHDFEFLILVIHHGLRETGLRIEHCTSGDIHYQLLHVDSDDLKHWVVAGDNREIVKYFLLGKIIWDIDGKVAALRKWINDFGEQPRERRKFKEFAKFLKVYVEAKQYVAEHDLLDAYYSVLQALKHYARLELIEQGILPERSVWEQVRPLNSVVYKLFDELTDSKETLEQRIQLVLLACEFSITTKMADCCSLLLRILSSRKEAWTIQELACLPELEHVREELPLMLRKLVYRSSVRENSSDPRDANGEEREIRYRA